jgi:crossover junction endodeoxyribonuclease RusA
MSATLHFELPKALVLNANDRMHWAPRASVVRNLRAMGAREARHHERMERAHLWIGIGYADKRRRDDHNLMPTFKALIDGITEHLLPDDSREYLVGPDLRSYVAAKRGLLVLDFTFSEVAP